LVWKLAPPIQPPMVLKIMLNETADHQAGYQ